MILIHNNQYVLTKHRKRGLEFPGGKVESGETAKQAAIREVHEETGCFIRTIEEIGQYHIPSISDDFIKSIFLAQAEKVDEEHVFLETEGRYFWDTLTRETLQSSPFSYIMQDGVVYEILQYLQEKSPRGFV